MEAYRIGRCTGDMSGRLSPLDNVLIPFDLLRPVNTDFTALHALPRIAPRQHGLTLRLVAVNRLSRDAVSTRRNKIPAKGLAES